MNLIKSLHSKKRLKFLLMALALTIPPIVSTTVFATIIKVDNQNKYWFFDNKSFDSLPKVYDYIQKNTNKSSFRAEAKSYLVNDNLFNSQIEMNNYLQTNFPIRDDIYTYHDPQNYVINSAGELSRQVLWNEDSGVMTVYEGKDGIGYTNRKQALDTYKRYKKVYLPDKDQEFDSFYDTYNYLKQVRMDELKEEKKEMFYPNGGIYQTEGAIKSWLRKNIKRGFAYNGREFSDFNYDKFLNFFASLNSDDQLFTENIKPIADANLSSYWVNLDQVTHAESGTFSGPKYFETSFSMQGKIKPGEWKEIDSYQPGLIMGITGAAMIGSTITTKYKERNLYDEFKWITNDDNNKEKTNIGFYNFLIYLQKKLKMIDEDIVEEVKNTLLKNVNLDKWEQNKDNFETRLIQGATIDLDSLASDSPEFTNLHKFMVAIKRILNYIKIFASFSEQDIANVERVLQKLVYQILTFNLKDQNNNDEGLDDDVFGLKENLEPLPLRTLISLILDPNDFYKSGERMEEILKIMKKGDQVISAIGNVVKGTSKIFNKVKDKIDAKNAAQDYENLKEEVKDLHTKVDKIFEEKASDILKSMGLKNLNQTKTIDTFSGVTSLAPPLKIASLLFDLEKSLSFIQFKTYEYKIDDHQSIYYYIQVPKMPVINVSATVDLPTLAVNTVSEAITNKMIPKGNEKLDGTPSEVYEFQGKYYLNKNNAKKALKAAIYLTPELFIPTKEILTSNIESDDRYILSRELKISKHPNDGGLTPTQYHEFLNQEIDSYVQILFDKHYKNNGGVEAITDGFGHIMENATEAQKALERLLRDGNEVESLAYYVYEAGEKPIYKKTQEELDNIIDQNQDIVEKEVISDDLIRTAIFDDLEEFTNKYYNIYELSFYGNKKYFATYNQAWTYLINHVASNYKEFDYEFKEESYQYKNVIFKTQLEYDAWIKKQIKEVDYNEFLRWKDQ